MKDLVSIVVPIYNVEKYLDRCLDSIVAQTYRNLDIILVDDGSPDSCPQMCDAWAKKDSRIRVIHKRNQGLGMARNTGIENALGTYICFFDSDDYIAAETVEKAVKVAREEQAEVVIFGMTSVDGQGEERTRIVPKAEKLFFEGTEVQNQLLPALIDSKCAKSAIKNLCLSACCCLFSMKLIEQTEWRFISERKNISEDSYSLIWLFKYVHSAAVLPEPLYYYYVNDMSLSRSYRPDRYEKIKLFYRDTLTMAERQGYGENVLRGIDGLFLGFSIGAMKQIVSLDVEFMQKKRKIVDIVNDAEMKHVLQLIPVGTYGLAREIFCWSVRHQYYLLCYVLLVLQSIRLDKKIFNFFAAGGK